MTTLALRRVAGGREPVREVVRWEEPGVAEVWRSRGEAVGRFAAADGPMERVRAAVAAAAAVEPPASPDSLPAHALADYLTLDEVSLAVPAEADLGGPWGDLLVACRAALEAPGAPIAAVTLVPDPPGRLRIEHRGEESLELGFGALNAGIAWLEDGVETGYAGIRLAEGVVQAGPGWSRTLALEGPAETPAGEAVARATFSIQDEGVWIPVVLEVRIPG